MFSNVPFTNSRYLGLLDEGARVIKKRPHKINIMGPFLGIDLKWKPSKIGHQFVEGFLSSVRLFVNPQIGIAIVYVDTK
jgi:hypothetical protein